MSNIANVQAVDNRFLHLLPFFGIYDGTVALLLSRPW